MKIVIVCPNDFSIVNFSGEFVKQLQQENKNTVYSICDIHGAHGEGTDGYYKQKMEDLGVIHLPINYYRFFSITKDIKYIYSLFKILRKEKFDLVINIATKANIYSSIISWLIGAPKVICCNWGLGVVFADSDTIKSKILKFVLIKLYWFSFRLCDRIWFTNKFDYEWFIKEKIIFNNNSFLTKNYVNTTDYSPDSISSKDNLKLKKEYNLSPNDKIVVMVARMSWAKGVKEFAEAAQLLRNEHNDVKFILVGPLDEGSTDSVPESYLIENQKNDNFIWTGFVKNVKAFYAISDLAVLPTYYREGGYPRGLTEAMAMGKPIITTDSEHCRGTVDNGKNGYRVPIKNSKGLAEAIKKIITDENKIIDFGKYSRQKAINEFDEEKIIAEVIKNIF